MENILRNRIYANGRLPSQSRRLRLGVIGGGRIAQTQAMAARLNGRWEVVAGALSFDSLRSRDRASAWHIDPAHSYLSIEEMAQVEAQRPDAIGAVLIKTPNNMHFSAGKVFLEAGFDVICDKY